jgi:hypothetical protein
MMSSVLPFMVFVMSFFLVVTAGITALAPTIAAAVAAAAVDDGTQLQRGSVLVVRVGVVLSLC